MDWGNLPDSPKNNGNMRDGNVLIEDEKLPNVEYKKRELMREIRNSEEDVRAKLAKDAYYYFADEIVKQAKFKYGRLDFSSNLDRSKIETVEVAIDRAMYLVDCVAYGNGKFLGYGTESTTEYDLVNRLMELNRSLRVSLGGSICLRESVIENGLMSEEDVSLLFGNGDRVDAFVEGIRNELGGAFRLKDMLLKKARVEMEREHVKSTVSDQLLVDQLRKYGRKFGIVNEHTFVGSDWEYKPIKIYNEKVIVTSRGVFTVVCVELRDYDKLIVSNHGELKIDNNIKDDYEIREKYADLIDRMSQNVGYTVEKLREKMGRFIPVMPIVLLVGENRFEVKNESVFKVIRPNMLYEAVYGFGEDGNLTNADVDTVCRVLEDMKNASMDVAETYSILDYKILTDMWAEEYKTLTKLCEVVNYFGTALERFNADYGLS